MSEVGSLAVIGGGIAGLASAIAAHQAGFDAHVFEQSMAPRTTGGPLWLSANAIRSLRALGAFGRVEPFCTRIVSYAVRDGQGRLLFLLPTDEFERKYGEPLMVVGRSDLLKALINVLPGDRLRFGYRCRGFIEQADTVSPLWGISPQVRTIIDQFDGMIGADGYHSAIQRQLATVSTKEPVGGWIWTGLSSRVSIPRRAIGEAELRLGVGQTFLSLPIASDSSPDGVVAWWAASAGSSVERWQELTTIGEPVRRILEHGTRETWMSIPVRDHLPRTSVGTGRVTLLGDAAHPMTPALGQGASQAIEGALTLGLMLQRHPSLEVAFRAYEAQHGVRARRIVRFSRTLSVGLTAPMPSWSRRLFTWFSLPGLFHELDYINREQD